MVKSKVEILIEYAKTWIGTPYGNGNSRSRIDCTRYMRRCFQKIKIKLPGGYPGPMYRNTKAKRKFQLTKKNLSLLQKGDLLYFINGDGRTGHAALYIGNGKIIHATSHGGVHIQNYLEGSGAYKGSGKKHYVARFFNTKGDNDSQSGVDIYLAEAKKHIGPGGKAWVKKNAPRFNEGAWCADTQCAIAKVTGFAGKIMSTASSLAGGFGQLIVEKYNGKYIKGPGYGGGAVTPQPGDIIELFGGGCSKKQPWSAGHVGVVEYVKNGIVHTIEGNSSDSYRRREYKKGASNILWYARPNWDKVGGSSYNIGNDDEDDDTTNGGLLYDSLSTEADATIREVCYANDKGEPILKETDYRLSVANYTTVLFWIVYAFGGTAQHGESDDNNESDDGNWTYPKWMNSNMKYVFEFLMDKGFNKAATCGVLGNMKKENTNFKPGLFNGVDHYGICQWSSGRYKNTEHTIEAECNLLWKELNGGYNGVKSSLKAVSDNVKGCKRAAEAFCRHYEICGNYSYEVPKRQELALKFYSDIKKSANKEGDGKTVKGWKMPYKKGTTYYGNNDGDFLAQRSYERHPGIDLSTPSNRTVLAINGGTVIRAGWYGAYGQCVEIKHANGYVSRYGHASSLSVKQGDKVSAGQKIMTAGGSGKSGMNTYGVHLHLELHKNGKLISPRTVLPIPDYTTNSFKQFKV